MLCKFFLSGWFTGSRLRVFSSSQPKELKKAKTRFAVTAGDIAASAPGKDRI
jgi:hypothetical protein